MSTTIVMVLIMQCVLIGVSVWAISRGIAPRFMAVHVACIAANVLFGLVNVINMTK